MIDSIPTYQNIVRLKQHFSPSIIHLESITLIIKCFIQMRQEIIVKFITVWSEGIRNKNNQLIVQKCEIETKKIVILFHGKS